MCTTSEPFEDEGNGEVQIPYTLSAKKYPSATAKYTIFTLNWTHLEWYWTLF